jgi:hypothetical protein
MIQCCDDHLLLLLPSPRSPPFTGIKNQNEMGVRRAAVPLLSVCEEKAARTEEKVKRVIGKCPNCCCCSRDAVVMPAESPFDGARFT